MSITTAQWRQMFELIARSFDAEKERLCELDGEFGNGNHGLAMARGWRAVTVRLAAMPASTSCGALSQQAAHALLGAVGGSSAPLYAAALMRGGAALGNTDPIGEREIAAFFSAAVEGMRTRSNAGPGDKTLLDAWLPAVAALQAAHASGAPLAALLQAAREGAERGAEASREMTARNADRLDHDGGRGHLDPGAVSTALLFRVMESSLAGGETAPS